MKILNSKNKKQRRLDNLLQDLLSVNLMRKLELQSENVPKIFSNREFPSKRLEQCASRKFDIMLD